MSAEPRYHYEISMESQQAVTYSELLALFESGKIASHTLCWLTGIPPVYRLFSEIKAEHEKAEREKTPIARPKEFVSFVGNRKPPREYFQKKTRFEVYEEIEQFLREKELGGG